MLLNNDTETVKKTTEKLLNNPLILKLFIPNYYKRLVAFALAEVLIALLIIGTVASLVVPAILQDTQNAELKTAWKKTYADLEQATRRALLDNGGSFKDACSGDWDNDCLANFYKKHLNYTKFCPSGQSFGNCWHNDGDMDSYEGVSYGTGWGNVAGIITNSGILLHFALISNACTEKIGIISMCGNIKIDVNGFKSPNTIGKDIYFVYVLENSIKPYGISGDNYDSDWGYNHSGYARAAKYLYE